MIENPDWYNPPPENERTDRDRDDIDIAWNWVVRGAGTLLNSTEGHLAVLRAIRYGRESGTREARAAALEEAKQVAIAVADEELPPVLANKQQAWASACGRILTRLHILTGTPPQSEGGEG